MSARSYLSIGDVLTLLRQEFPDVTISKIRFLESQGLVNPERTPSGYRKFYEHDVERLRWVLRQQREHFLPLKVIKDRLDDGTDGSNGSSATPVDVPASQPISNVGQREDVEPDLVHTSEPVLVGQATVAHAHASSAAPPVADPASPVTPGPGLPGLDGVSGPPSLAADRSVAPARTTTSGPVDAPPPSTWAHAARRDRPSSPPAKSSSGGADEPSPPQPETGPPSRGAAPAPSQRAASAPQPEPVRGSAAAESRRADLSSTSLTLAELVTASGLDADVIGQLREFGLLAPVLVGGIEYFDEDSLAIANLAAGFARFGVEPRHLRLYKNAADREAGFVEQIVLPLVRQRNPEASQRASTTADELISLGQGLRGALLRTALRDLLGG